MIVLTILEAILHAIAYAFVLALNAIALFVFIFVIGRARSISQWRKSLDKKKEYWW